MQLNMEQDHSAQSALILKIAAEVFEVSPEQLSPSTSMYNLTEWDSLNHIKLLDSIEEHFQLQLPIEKAIAVRTIQDWIDLVTSTLA